MNILNAEIWRLVNNSNDVKCYVTLNIVWYMMLKSSPIIITASMISVLRLSGPEGTQIDFTNHAQDHGV